MPGYTAMNWALAHKLSASGVFREGSGTLVWLHIDEPSLISRAYGRVLCNTITSPGTYWWYFLVTAATVGYGDFFPTTIGGRLVGVYVIVGGIVTLTTLFTRIAAWMETRKDSA